MAEPFFEQLAAHGRPRQLPARSIVYLEGDHGRDVVLVRRGDLKVAKTIDGREVVLDVVGPGDFVGEVAALDDRPRSATVSVLTAAEIVVVPFSAFLDVLERHPGVALAIARRIAARLRHASRRQTEYGSLDAAGRVCARLVELMPRYGRRDGCSVVIRAPLSQGEIAAWAGLSREAVVKALRGLRAAGWITTSPRTITVLDVAAVTSRATGS